ncbi:peptidylprolyl isomerase [Enterococcus sp. LJL99]
MKKKLILAAAGLFSIFALAACSSSSQDIATMKGGSITVDDFFNQVKGSSESQQTVQSMIIYKVFEEKYGKDVSDKDVQKEFDKIKEQAKTQGSNVEDFLKQYGYTEKSYKALAKQQLAFQAGLDAHIKITDEDLKTAWETFHPEVEAQIIQVGTEDEANDLAKQLKDGGDFTKLAKEKSLDTATKEDGGEIKFDSQSTTVPAAVKEAAFKLKDGEVSEVIQATDSTGYQSAYYIVKMTKNKAKGNDMDPYKKELKEIATTTKKNDQAFTTEVISDELKAANVKIKNDSFKDVLANFIKTEDSSTSDSEKTSKSSSTEEKSSKSSDSSKSEDSSSKTEESSSKTEDSSK